MSNDFDFFLRLLPFQIQNLIF